MVGTYKKLSQRGEGLTDKYQEISQTAAEAIANQLREKPTSCFGLPTGRTPVGMYRILAGWSHQMDWSQAKCFALDDYLEAEESQTFARFLEDHLFRHINLPRENRFNPRLVENYDHLIAEKGGLDLTVVGIGRNGHIAFNEPGTRAQSWTHCVELTESTRQANASFFSGIDNVPEHAVTMGLATIMESRKLILIASGEHKKDILEESFAQGVNTQIPASLLQLHEALTILSDFDWQR
jgi:glucosamine-6-phosphate deaminase